MRGINLFNVVVGIILIVIVFSVMILFYSVIYSKINLETNPLINLVSNLYIQTNNIIISPDEIELNLPISSLGNCYLKYTDKNFFSTQYPKIPANEKVINYYKKLGYVVYSLDCKNKEIYNCVKDVLGNEFVICCYYLKGVCFSSVNKIKYVFLLKNYRIPIIDCEDKLFIYNLKVEDGKISMNFDYNGVEGNINFYIPYNPDDPKFPEKIYIKYDGYIEIDKDIYKDYILDLKACERVENGKLVLIHPSYIYMKKAMGFYFTPNLLLQVYNPLDQFNECLNDVFEKSCEITLDKKLGILFIGLENKLYLYDIKYNNLIYIPLKDIFEKVEIYVSKDKKISILGIIYYSKIFNFVIELINHYKFLEKIINLFLEAKEKLKNTYTDLTLTEKLAMYTIILSLLEKVKDGVNSLTSDLNLINNSINYLKFLCQKTSNFLCNLINYNYQSIEDNINNILTYINGLVSTSQKIYDVLSSYLFQKPEYIGLSLAIIENTLSTMDFTYFEKNKDVLVQASQKFILVMLEELESLSYDISLLQSNLNNIKTNLISLLNKILNSRIDENHLDSYNLWNNLYNNVLLKILDNIGNEEIQMIYLNNKLVLIIE